MECIFLNKMQVANLKFFKKCTPSSLIFKKILGVYSNSCFDKQIGSSVCFESNHLLLMFTNHMQAWALKEIEYCLLLSCPLSWEVEGFSCSWLVSSIILASVCLFSQTLLTTTETTSLRTDFTADSIAGSCLINFCLPHASYFLNGTGDYN